jgi:hypothetical protein
MSIMGLIDMVIELIAFACLNQRTTRLYGWLMLPMLGQPCPNCNDNLVTASACSP